MSFRYASGLAVASALFFSACSASNPAPPPAPTVSAGMQMTEKGGERHQEVQMTATVESVDLKKRTVTVVGFDGERDTLNVGDEVRNLPQVKKGDHVVVTYHQSVAFEVVDPKQVKLGAEGIGGVGRAKEGEKPAGLAAESVVVVADIVKLDRQKQTAVLKTSDGRTATVDIERPEVFDKVKVGDRVAIRMTEAMAIEVREVARK